MEQVRRLAYQSVAKGCGFATLAILTTLVGLSYNPVLATRVGGALMTLMALVLMIKAWRAPTQSYRRTEVWLLLDDHERPAPSTAQWAIGHARQEALLRFAQFSAGIAATFWAAALILALVGA